MDANMEQPTLSPEARPDRNSTLRWVFIGLLLLTIATAAVLMSLGR